MLRRYGCRGLQYRPGILIFDGTLYGRGAYTETAMTKKLTFALLALGLLACAPRPAGPVDYVDPFIGTGYHGHTYPGATTPFGMVQLSPDTRAGDWDACAGYHYDDTTIDGFSHTHLSGTGCADLADILFHPTTREIVLHDGACVLQPYFFSHGDEKASCGYYAVELPGENIRVELTAAPRTGVHRYTFTGKGPRQVVVDLMHTIAEEQVDMRELRTTAPDEIAGMRRTQGWVPDQYVFFSARFSEPFADVRLLGDKQAVLTFAPDTETLTIAVGLSSVSAANARLNSVAEVPELDFDAVHARAAALWREALGDIVVEGGSRDEMVNFYTAQYHTKLTPNLMSDVNGEYRRHDQRIARMPQGGAYYSTFSLWDTFRAWNPLQTLVDTTLVNDMIRSMLDMYDITGELPIWPLASGETGTMIGYHAASVIADAYLKGIRGYDAEKALDAMIRSSNINKKGSDYYVVQGFIPSNIKRESVSCTLEYAYDDWAISRMAGAMGRDDVAREYAQRALNYANVFDGSTCFFRGRGTDGNWSEPFEEFATGRDYTEATPWHYRFFVPHDVNGLAGLFGSREAFVRELDRLFTLESDEMQLDVSDVTGLMGQYAHGNEPSHHMAYLYNYVGQPWRTQELTRSLLHGMYAPTPAGIIGNEDCGQMSAWYILQPGLLSRLPRLEPVCADRTPIPEGRRAPGQRPHADRYGKQPPPQYLYRFGDARRSARDRKFHHLRTTDAGWGTAFRTPYGTRLRPWNGCRSRALFAYARPGRFDSLYHAEREPLHRACGRRPGHDDGRSRNPLYARRLGAGRNLGALCRARRCRPLADAQSAGIQTRSRTEPYADAPSREGRIPQGTARSGRGHASGCRLCLLRRRVLACGRDSPGEARSVRDNARAVDCRCPAGRPFRIYFQRLDPHSRTGRVGVHDQER